MEFIFTGNVGMVKRLMMCVVLLLEREPPAIELYPSSHQTVTMGSSTLLQCRVISGIPQPKVWWVRGDGRQLSHNIEELSGGVLR